MKPIRGEIHTNFFRVDKSISDRVLLSVRLSFNYQHEMRVTFKSLYKKIYNETSNKSNRHK